MELQIRKAHADDIPHIMALQARSLRVLSAGTYSDVQIETLVRTQGQARVRYFNSGDEMMYVAHLKGDGIKGDGIKGDGIKGDGIKGDGIKGDGIKGDEDGAPHEPSVHLVAMAAFIPWQSQIGGLYVHPDFVRRGIASQLLQAVEAEAVSQRHQVIRVMSSVMAVPFYEARGFRRLFSRTVRFEGEKVACVEMAKSLSADSLLLGLAKQMVPVLALVIVTMAVVWCAVFWL